MEVKVLEELLNNQKIQLIFYQILQILFYQLIKFLMKIQVNLLDMSL